MLFCFYFLHRFNYTPRILMEFGRERSPRNLAAVTRNILLNCKLFLKKAASSDFITDIEQNDTLALIQESIHLAPRLKEIVKTVTVESSQIRIQLYDNGEIDNDTITVFINNKLLLYRQRLTEKP